METTLSTDQKRCARCRRWKPLAAYHKDKGRTDGLQVHCAPCNTDVTQIGALRRLLRSEGREALYERLREHAHQTRLIDEVLEWDDLGPIKGQKVK